MRTIKSITLTPRRRKYMLFALIAIALIGFAAYGMSSVVHLKGNLNSQQIKIKNNQAELKQLNTELDKAKMEHQKDESVKQEQIQKLEQEKKDLEAQLQAKAEAKAKLAEAARNTLNTVTGTQTAYAASAPVRSAPAASSIPIGSHEDWMAAAGIPAGDYGYVNYIVNHESGWNPNAVNASSGACGLGQQLPCGKWAGAWNDPVAALVAMQGYALARYGSWGNAYSFWIANNWW